MIVGAQRENICEAKGNVQNKIKFKLKMLRIIILREHLRNENYFNYFFFCDFEYGKKST